MRNQLIACLLGCALLAACNGDKAATDGAQADDGLPKPGAVSGSVTGMPNPGVVASRPQATAAMEAPGDILDAIPQVPMDGVADAEFSSAEDPGELDSQTDPTLPEPPPAPDATTLTAPENGDATIPPAQP